MQNEDSTPSSQSAVPTTLLEHFHGPDVPVPPSARIGDPTLKQRESQPWGLWQLWKAGKFAAAKGALNIWNKHECLTYWICCSHKYDLGHYHASY